MAENDADEEGSTLRPLPPAPATPARASPGASTPHAMTPSTPPPRTTPPPLNPPPPKSPLRLPVPLGKDLLDAAVRGRQLLSFDDDVSRDLLNPKFPDIDFPPANEDINLNGMMPSDFWMVEPRMGRALRAELAELLAEEYTEMILLFAREGGFAQRWWKWWEIGQPAARMEDDEWLAPEDVEDDKWEDMRKRFGRNGILLYVGGLFWWGEAAAADEEHASELLAEWRVAVEDVRQVLAEVVKGVCPSVGHQTVPVTLRVYGGVITVTPPSRLSI
ncbi:hypothetical protein B0H14DRAFT_3525880 [Mycena olivaceomarginata]|nr:hypothetical protein B0H14DRAFT_3525880 [Mycena olivaceomarginata]